VAYLKVTQIQSLQKKTVMSKDNTESKLSQSETQTMKCHDEMSPLGKKSTVQLTGNAAFYFYC